MGKSIIIVGAGIAGLTAGCYGRMNGYNTRIFEMHSKPGGLCTAWERQGYVIDGCLHWLVGTSPDSSMYRLWQEVGVLQGKNVINMDQFIRVETTDGKTIVFYSDVDKLEKHFKEIAPEDSAFIEEITAAIRQFGKIDMPAGKAPEISNPLDGLKMMVNMSSVMGAYRKWGNMTVKDFALRFKNPSLREAWQLIMPPEFSSMAILMTFAWLSRKNAGYLTGGSIGIALAMEKRYHELGGNIVYKARVKKILVENDRAVGIRLDDGTEHKADYVISAADGHTTIFNMLEGKYVNDAICDYYQKFPIFQPLVYVGLGVNRSFEDVPQVASGLVFPLDKPLIVGNREHKYLGAHIFNFDPSFAAQGKTVITVSIDSEYAYWEELRKDLDKYKAEKERIAVAVVSALNKRFPGLAKQLEMWDVATPVTFHRYTGNWQGSFEGWLLTPQNVRLRMKKTLPGLDNFYMIGHWVQPGGGLPTALMTGNHVIQMICHQDRKKFTTSLPQESTGS